MNEKALATLATTSPKLAYRTFAEAAAKIQSLETALGLPAGKPTWNIRRANSRIAELESMLAGGKAAPVSLPTVAAVTPEKIIATASQFLALSTTDRACFSTDGGKLALDGFNDLPVAAKMKHFEDGGKVVATTADKTTLAAALHDGPNPKNSGTMLLATFNQLGKGSQLALIRHGVKLAVKAEK
jgi:hypothetical protein